MWQWVKTHPYITGLGALALFVLIYLVTRTGSSPVQVTGQTGPSEALQAANLQAASHAADVQAAANSQQSQLNAALAAKQIDAQTALQIAQAQRDVALRQTVGSETIASRQADSVEKAAQLQADAINQQTQAQKEIASKGLDVQGMGIQAGVQIAGIQSQVALASISAQLAAAKDANAAATHISDDQNITERYGITAARDVSLTQLADQLTLGLDTNDKALQGLLSNNDTSIIINGQNTSSVNYQATLNYQLGSLITNNQTTVDLAGIAATVDIANLQAGVQNNFITTGGQVALAGIQYNTDVLNVSAAIQSNRDNMNFALQQNVLQQIGFQGLNKSSSIEALALVFNQPNVAIASIQGSAATDWGANLTKYTLPALATSFNISHLLG